MSNFLSLFSAPENNGDEKEEEIPPADDIVTLDKDALRKKRLETLSSQGGNDDNSGLASSSSSSSSPVKTADSSSKAVIKDVQLSSPSATPIAEKAKPLASPSPTKVVTSPSPNRKSENFRTVEDVKLDRYAKSLNDMLEQVFLFSVRKGAPAPLQVLEVDFPLLAIQNISELLCSKFSYTFYTKRTSHMGYLYDCYKRVCNKQNTISSDVLREDLNKCRAQIVSFMGTLLSEDEMFDETKEMAVGDLFLILGGGKPPSDSRFSSDGGDNISIKIALTRELMEELIHLEACNDVMSALVGLCYQGFDLPVTQAAAPNPMMAFGMMPQMQAMRSILDRETYEPSLRVFQILCTADKKFLKSLPSNLPDTFLLPAAKKVANPAVSNHYFHGGAERMGTGGAALEHCTLLGRMLRQSPNPQDPKVRDLLKNTHKDKRTVAEDNIMMLRNSMIHSQNQANDLISSLLKCGGSAKELTMEWLYQCAELNADAAKEHPSPMLSSSIGFLNNAGAVYLKLCRPFIMTSDVATATKMLSKVNWSILLAPDIHVIFPDVTKLMIHSPLSTSTTTTPVKATAASPQKIREFNFITQIFFLASRMLHLGVAQQCNSYKNYLQGLQRFRDELDTGGPSGMHYLMIKLCTDISLLSPDLLTDAVAYCVAMCSSLLMLLDAPGSSSTVKGGLEGTQESDWVVSASELTANQLEILSNIPEHLVNDIMEILLVISRTEPVYLTNSTQSLYPVLSMVIYFLRRPWAVSSPHVRAKFGLVLASVFLPFDARGEDVERWSNATRVQTDGKHVLLLDNHEEVQKYLAPSLLLLYGDVERTGFYEKLSHRQNIMVVLKYLWSLPSHRAAFRGIATCSSDLSAEAELMASDNSAQSDDVDMPGSFVSQQNYFIRFANGLMNETNSLVSSTLELLQSIKAHQLLMGSSEWNGLTVERRDELIKEHEQNERECRFKASLCNKTLNMLTYLTSDEIIRRPFLMQEILPRFVSMLMNMLARLVGSKSLDLKVENMAAYNFYPKEMLRDVVQAMIQFAEYEEFWRGVCEDGYYSDGAPLKKAVSTVQRLGLMSAADVETFQKFIEDVSVTRVKFQDIDSLTDDAPEEFLDPLLMTIMRNPMLLPTSNIIIDKSTISQHLLNEETDPFNRSPLTAAELKPANELKARIHAWLTEKGVDVSKL